MSPLLPFSLKASPSQPTASIENSFGSSFTFASTGSSMLLSPTSAPSLPPSTTATTAATTTTTTTTTTSLDSKPSPFNTTASQSSSSSCAFPSWPNRPSLVSTNTCTSTTSASSAYISDEELLDTPLSSPAVESECPFDDAVQVQQKNSAVSMGMGTTSMSFASEQRIRHMREVAEEEEHRAKFLAQVQAHARVQMAKRGLQPPPQPQPQPQQQGLQQQQQQQAPIAARRKRRAIVPVGKKRRAASGTSSRGYPRV